MGFQSQAPIFNLNGATYVRKTVVRRIFFFLLPHLFSLCWLTQHNKAGLLVTLDFIDKPAIIHTSWDPRGQRSQTRSLEGQGNIFGEQGHLWGDIQFKT